jgi:hypothetical protein
LTKHNTGSRNDSRTEVVATATPATETMNPLASKAATVAAVGLGVALIEVELLPGMLIGIAAMLAPSLLPRIGNALRPMLKSAVRAGYAIADKTREAVSEASEQIQDIVAEVQSEQTALGQRAKLHKDNA